MEKLDINDDFPSKLTNTLYDIVFIGGGPATLAFISYLFKNGLSDNFFKQNILIIEKSSYFGSGCLGKYGINSNTSAEGFVRLICQPNETSSKKNKIALSPDKNDVVKKNKADLIPMPIFHGLYQSSVTQLLLSIGTKVTPLNLVGEFLQSAGNCFLNQINKNHNKNIFLGESEVLNILQNKNPIEYEITLLRRNIKYMIKSKVVILACGAKQRFYERLKNLIFNKISNEAFFNSDFILQEHGYDKLYNYINEKKRLIEGEYDDEDKEDSGSGVKKNEKSDNYNNNSKTKELITINKNPSKENVRVEEKNKIKENNTATNNVKTRKTRKKKTVKVVIIGGSHSGFSCAWILLNSFAKYNFNSVNKLYSKYKQKTFIANSTNNDSNTNNNIVPCTCANYYSNSKCVCFGDINNLNWQSTNKTPIENIEITIVYKDHVKVYYPTEREALNDGYNVYDPAKAVNKNSNVYPFIGIRGDAKELYRNIVNGKEKRVSLLKCARQEDMLKLINKNTIVIWAGGYTSNLIPIYERKEKNSNNNNSNLFSPIELFSEDGSTCEVTKELNVINKNKTPIKNMLGIGQGYSTYSIEILANGKRGKSDSVNLYSTHIAKKLFKAIEEIFQKSKMLYQNVSRIHDIRPGISNNTAVVIGDNVKNNNSNNKSPGLTGLISLKNTSFGSNMNALSMSINKKSFGIKINDKNNTEKKEKNIANNKIINDGINNITSMNNNNNTGYNRIVKVHKNSIKETLNKEKDITKEGMKDKNKDMKENNNNNKTNKERNKSNSNYNDNNNNKESLEDFKERKESRKISKKIIPNSFKDSKFNNSSNKESKESKETKIDRNFNSTSKRKDSTHKLNNINKSNEYNAYSKTTTIKNSLSNSVVINKINSNANHISHVNNFINEKNSNDKSIVLSNANINNSNKSNDTKNDSLYHFRKSFHNTNTNNSNEISKNIKDNNINANAKSNLFRISNMSNYGHGNMNNITNTQVTGNYNTKNYEDTGYKNKFPNSDINHNKTLTKFKELKDYKGLNDIQEEKPGHYKYSNNTNKSKHTEEKFPLLNNNTINKKSLSNHSNNQNNNNILNSYINTNTNSLAQSVVLKSSNFYNNNNNSVNINNGNSLSQLNQMNTLSNSNRNSNINSYSNSNNHTNYFNNKIHHHLSSNINNNPNINVSSNDIDKLRLTPKNNNSLYHSTAIKSNNNDSNTNAGLYYNYSNYPTTMNNINMNGSNIINSSNLNNINNLNKNIINQKSLEISGISLNQPTNLFKKNNIYNNYSNGFSSSYNNSIINNRYQSN